MNTLVASKVLDHTGKPFKREDPARVALHNRLKAKYDSAQTTSENQTHWSYADGLSAASANDPETRRKLRNRSRYEIANNSYAAGMVRTMANEVVGTGPRVQLNTGSGVLDKLVETEFWKWCQATKFAQKLAIQESMQWVDGESFALMVSNLGLRTRVKLDLKLYEADQVARPWAAFDDPLMSDGIVYDDFGNPVSYNLLKHHPGDMTGFDGGMDSETIRADQMIHRFICERPGQVRGVPGILPSLPLYAQLRRYTLAVIAAAETAADLAVLLQTHGSAIDPDELEPLDLIDLERRTAMTLPRGWEANQMKSEQPTTTYPQFKREIINEISRPMNMPSNVASGDSAGYNYASGRLDHQTFYKFIGVRRYYTEVEALVRVFEAWWNEARMYQGYLPIGRNDPAPVVLWNWDGREHVDPQKEGNAAVTLVDAGLLSEARFHSKQGNDWEDEEAQIAKEYGITVDELRKRKLEKRFAVAAVRQPIEDDDDE